MKDYRQIEKDPVIDLVRTGFQKTNMTIPEVAYKAFVRPETIRRWLYGEVKRPWNITVDCVLEILGIRREATWIETGEKVEVSKKPFKVIEGGKAKKRKAS